VQDFQDSPMCSKMEPGQSARHAGAHHPYRRRKLPSGC
jgi:hypothetical protein